QLAQNNRSRCRPGCVSPRRIIAPIRLADAQDTAAATRVVPSMALAVTEFGPDSGVKTFLTGKRLRARSFSRSSSTMGVQDGHIAKTFSIPILGTPVPHTGRTRFMAAFARLISPAARLKGGAK